MPKPSKISKFRQQQALVTTLAKPRRFRKKWKPKTKISTGVRKSALKGRCTSLVNNLAQPLPRQHLTIADMRVPQPKVAPSALKVKPRPWNIRSALPKLKAVRQTKRDFRNKLPKRQKEALEKTLQQVMKNFNDEHPAEGVHKEAIILGAIVHKKCCKETVVDRGTKICELTKKKRFEFQTHMLRMGLPNIKKPPPKPDRGKGKPLKEFEKRLMVLTEPRAIDIEPPWNPYAVRSAALNAECTERLAVLALHREPRPPAPVYDFRGHEILPPRAWTIEARRRVKASERTEELATPKRVKNKRNDDEKEDPFRVSPAALKAQCSQRLIELATPVDR